MALRDNENQYYYFKMRLGRPFEIKVTSVHINTLINLIYQEMTVEQREFYIEHPTAAVMEVWNCEIASPYIPQISDVQEYASEKVKERKEVCYNSVTVTSLEYAAAEDKVNNVLADSYYFLSEANSVLASFRSQTKKALQVINTYTSQILDASTIGEVDTLYNQAVELL